MTLLPGDVPRWGRHMAVWCPRCTPPGSDFRAASNPFGQCTLIGTALEEVSPEHTLLAYARNDYHVSKADLTMPSQQALGSSLQPYPTAKLADAVKRASTTVASLLKSSKHTSQSCATFVCVYLTGDVRQ